MGQTNITRINIVVSKARMSDYEWMLRYCNETGKSISQVLFEGVAVIRADVAAEQARANDEATE